MRNGKFGCALWGCGWVASGHIAAYLKNNDCELVGIGSRRRESAQAKIDEFGLHNIKVYEKFEDILKNITPHKLRASAATNLAASGVSIQAIAKVLGHENIQTTRRDVEVLDEEAYEMVTTKTIFRIKWFFF